MSETQTPAAQALAAVREFPVLAGLEWVSDCESEIEARVGFAFRVRIDRTAKRWRMTFGHWKPITSDRLEFLAWTAAQNLVDHIAAVRKADPEVAQLRADLEAARAALARVLEAALGCECQDGHCCHVHAAPLDCVESAVGFMDDTIAYNSDLGDEAETIHARLTEHGIEEHEDGVSRVEAGFGFDPGPRRALLERVDMLLETFRGLQNGAGGYHNDRLRDDVQRLEARAADFERQVTELREALDAHPACGLVDAAQALVAERDALRADVARLATAPAEPPWLDAPDGAGGNWLGGKPGDEATRHDVERLGDGLGASEVQEYGLYPLTDARFAGFRWRRAAPVIVPPCEVTP